MKLLLDTCTFLWITTDAKDLSLLARELFQDPSNDVFLSSVSAWEISIKCELGRLPLPDSPDRFVPRQREFHGIDSLPLQEVDVLHLPKLPELHRDPFDRAIVCQAIAHGFTILTPDKWITQYPARTIW